MTWEAEFRARPIRYQRLEGGVDEYVVEMTEAEHAALWAAIVALRQIAAPGTPCTTKEQSIAIDALARLDGDRGETS